MVSQQDRTAETKVGVVFDITLRTSHLKDVFSTLLREGRLRHWKMQGEPTHGCPPMGDLSSWGGDGIVAHVMGAPERIAELERAGCPLVLLGASGGMGRHPCVWPDFEAGGRMAVDHLVSLGLDRLAFVGHPSLHFSRLMEKGYAERAKDQRALFFGSDRL